MSKKRERISKKTRWQTSARTVVESPAVLASIFEFGVSRCGEESRMVAVCREFVQEGREEWHLYDKAEKLVGEFKGLFQIRDRLACDGYEIQSIVGMGGAY